MSAPTFISPDVYTDIAVLRHLVREANALGAKFRISGHAVEIAGLDTLPVELRTKLEGHSGPGGLLWAYLDGDAEDEPSLALADELGVEAVLVETRLEARRAVRALIADQRLYSDDGAIGVDIETAPKPEYFEPVYTKLNRNGAVSANQPESKSKAGLSPYLSTVACLSLYAGGRYSYVFRDAALQAVLHSHWFWKQDKLVHNAGFELRFWLHECTERFLPAYPHRLGRIECTMQACGLLHGVGNYGGEKRNLVNMARLRLRGLVVPKGHQQSGWLAATLSPGQVAYSACDPVIPFQAWPRMRQELHRKGRWRAYELQNGAVEAVASMENHGILLDRAEHTRQSDVWAMDFAESRDRFTALTGDPAPTAPAEIQAFLRKILSPAELRAWPPTPRKGDLSYGIDALRTISHRESVRALIDVLQNRNLLLNFGHGLAAKGGSLVYDAGGKSPLHPASRHGQPTHCETINKTTTQGSVIRRSMASHHQALIAAPVGAEA